LVKVKICGITNLEDALASVNASCDALGFVFYKKSPRYIDPRKAAEIVKKLPRNIIKVGVFVNAREKNIRRIAKLCSLNMLQFHGNESPQYCARFGNFRVIKAFRVKNHIDENELLKYHPFAYLFDNYLPSKAGGTGKEFDWKLIRHLDRIKRPVFLSGGLSVRNVRRAIKEARPAWVDASSLLEKTPGRKDHKKVKEFIRRARRMHG